MSNTGKKVSSMNFGSVLQSTVPHARKGKHNVIVGRILSDLAQLRPGDAIKVPLDTLEDSKANIRSALNRAGRTKGFSVKTASDAQFLYVWSAPKPA